MTNEEKYKTPEERAKAFDKFCGDHDACVDCPSGRMLASDVCQFSWLALEAEEEKPMPCPFCGRQCEIFSNAGGEVVIVCEDCDYQYGNCMDKEPTIAVHNRICRAVKAYKEGEVTK